MKKLLIALLLLVSISFAESKIFNCTEDGRFKFGKDNFTKKYTTDCFKSGNSFTLFNENTLVYEITINLKTNKVDSAIRYYSNGQKEIDLGDKIAIFYYETGEISAINKNIKQINETFTNFNKDGSIKSISKYKNDIKLSTKEYYTNGSIKSISKYKDSKFFNKITYNYYGKIISKSHIVNDFCEIKDAKGNRTYLGLVNDEHCS